MPKSSQVKSEKIYWSNVFTASYQILFGIFAGTIAVGQLDQGKVSVLLLDGTLMVIFLFAGRRVLK